MRFLLLMKRALLCSKKVHILLFYPLLMMTILNYDQWLADADCPELIDAFNGPSDYVKQFNPFAPADELEDYYSC